MFWWRCNLGVNRYLTCACAAGFEVKIVLVMLSGSLVYDECYICGGDNETCKDCAGDVLKEVYFMIYAISVEEEKRWFKFESWYNSW